MTTLRNVIGGLTLEQTLTSREGVNTELRTVLDEATGKWGIRVSRVEIKSVDPPPDIKAAMEKQMRAERDRRAAILTAEGTKQAAILTAEGEQRRRCSPPRAQRQAAILRAEGEAKAIATVFSAIHAGDADRKLLAYQYLQMLPKLAEGDANKVFVIPSRVHAGVRRDRRRARAPTAKPAVGGGGAALPGRRPDGATRRGGSTSPRVPAARDGSDRRAATAPRAARRGARAARCSTRSRRSSRRRSPALRGRGVLTEATCRARCARSASRCSRPTSTSGRQGVHRRGARARARRRGPRPAQPRASGRRRSSTRSSPR